MRSKCWKRLAFPARRGASMSIHISFRAGMRQRVMIAIALSCKPDILIADEPTTALDVTIQAQILDLLRQLQADFHMSILFITHDLGVVAALCHRVLVMYAGRIVEEAPARNLFATPRHPYTRGLLHSSPRWDTRSERLIPIQGSPPDLADLPPGCSFNPRCPACCGKVSNHRPPPLMPREDVGQHACLRSRDELGNGRSRAARHGIEARFRRRAGGVNPLGRVNLAIEFAQKNDFVSR